MTAQTLLQSLFRFKAAIDEELMAALTVIGATAPVENVRSALRVLQHAHLVDRIFAANLSGTSHAYTANWSKDAPLLADLAADTRAIDCWYLDYLSRIGPAELEETIDFIFTDGGPGRMSREEMLAHVITHGGYHRGEVGRLLPQIEGTAMRDVFAGYLHRSQPQRRL
jgi:uncharacterized damage-inducible protein DinB